MQEPAGSFSALLRLVDHVVLLHLHAFRQTPGGLKEMGGGGGGGGEDERGRGSNCLSLPGGLASLCKDVNERRHEPFSPIEPESNQFLSALAAGMSAQNIVEVSSQASESTVGLAVAARQTGGRLLCILPQSDSLDESKQVIEDSGLTDIVEFKVGDPYKLLPECENVDFSVVDCKTESYNGLLKLLDMNPKSLLWLPIIWWVINQAWEKICNLCRLKLLLGLQSIQLERVWK
ncbi:hypothetical protein HPP92_000508 [Vanilla planifolia]|uniref:Uncharacterized protein n=1 Tax=Vanilla planifolia TaxID=51239 RepID=A0A835VEG6_VANPL|nr:hypothetical protein HPP92_000508 [Vanilla planifolia]